MPLNEIPKHLSPETRRLVDAALEDAWRELEKDRSLDAEIARMKLERTIVILASVGETNPDKLKWFALHAVRGAELSARREKRNQQSDKMAALA